jgi:VIT1/CCC1 family predicted Fe2+/Mn2+ transporter
MARTHILDPIERFSEIVFGLIVVLSFTGALSVAKAGQTEVHRMMTGAILCNLAWGIIDAAFYLIACFTELRHKAYLLNRVQRCSDPLEVRKRIEEVLPETITEVFQSADFERMHNHLKQVTLPPQSLHLSRRDWLGGLTVLLLVFLSTLPVVLPFVFISNARLALHISNLIAVALLFASGQLLARYAGLHHVWMGLAMVLIGGVLVAITIALGG